MCVLWVAVMATEHVWCHSVRAFKRNCRGGCSSDCERVSSEKEATRVFSAVFLIICIIMRLFTRNKVSSVRPLITNTEEPVLLLKVAPLSQDHPPTTQPIPPTPKKGGCWAIRHLWKRRKGSYNVKDLLISNKEEAVVLLKVTPITEDRPPDDTPPPRDGVRGNGRGDEEAAPRLQPIPQPKSTTDGAIG